MLVDLGRVNLDASFERNLSYNFFHNWIFAQLHKGRTLFVIGIRLDMIL